ncbi:MAG TPA: DUF3862 domain-containing protein [Blastocatellia bacterium]|nr:DUF3862 domain-containing protein [Blastocatellia bacterium]
MLPPPSTISKWAVRILVASGILIVALITFVIIGAYIYRPRTPETDRLVILAPNELKKAVTLAQYQRLQTGMTYHQVVGILVVEGVEISRSKIGDHITVKYKWEGDGPGANLSATFQDGKLTQKTQFGLK